MKQNQLIKFFLLPALLMLLLAACKKEKQKDTTSPAYHIAESETLAMPAAVDLPVYANGYSRVATLYAEGVQKYKAQPKAGSNPVVYEWVFVAPEADLYDATNKKVGTHSAGPAWQLSGGADSIHAQQFSPARSAISPDAASIDWLQLMPKAGKVPTGEFAQVSYIQRIATQGGKAPIAPPVSASQTVDVKYTAVYRFTKKNP